VISQTMAQKEGLKMGNTAAEAIPKITGGKVKIYS